MCHTVQRVVILYGTVQKVVILCITLQWVVLVVSEYKVYLCYVSQWVVLLCVPQFSGLCVKQYRRAGGSSSTLKHFFKLH